MIKYIVSFFSLCFFALSSGPSIYIFCPPAAWPPLLLSCRAVHSAGRGGSLPRAWLGERLPSGCGRPCRPARTMPTLLPYLSESCGMGGDDTDGEELRSTDPSGGRWVTQPTPTEAEPWIKSFIIHESGGAARRGAAACGQRTADRGGATVPAGGGWVGAPCARAAAVPCGHGSCRCLRAVGETARARGRRGLLVAPLTAARVSRLSRAGYLNESKFSRFVYIVSGFSLADGTIGEERVDERKRCELGHLKRTTPELFF